VETSSFINEQLKVDTVLLSTSQDFDLQVGSLKSGAGGSAVEMIFDPMSDLATLAGWRVEPMKISVNAGEVKPLNITLDLSNATSTVSTAASGQHEIIEFILRGVGKGGTPALPPQGIVYNIHVHGHVKPGV
jgi:hypothetical protein